MADSVELSIQGLSGAELALLQCSITNTVYEVKQRISRFSDVLVGQQQLVFGCHALEDHRTLANYGVSTPKATLQCILRGPSGVALHLEAQKDSVVPDEALSASLSDVIDSVRQVEHVQSERHRPSASNLGRAMSDRRRSELVNWMLQAFEALEFSDEILHNTVLTLDRYYARLKSPIPDTSLQKVLLAAVCTELKMASGMGHGHGLGLGGQWQRVISHLCQGRLHVSSILQAEREVLASLDFVVGVPTPLTFLDGLCTRLEQEASTTEASQWRSAALFLLELAMFKPSIQYGYQHAVLAAGALAAALCTCGASADKHRALIEDVAAYCPVLPHMEEHVAACEEDLLTLWLQTSRHENELGEFYMHLEAKFGHRRRYSVARFSPQKALRRLHEATSPCTTPPRSPESMRSEVSPKGQDCVQKSIAAAAAHGQGNVRSPPRVDRL